VEAQLDLEEEERPMRARRMRGVVVADMVGVGLGVNGVCVVQGGLRWWDIRRGYWVVVVGVCY
jgi:hypothetical protein